MIFIKQFSKINSKIENINFLTSENIFICTIVFKIHIYIYLVIANRMKEVITLIVAIYFQISHLYKLFNNLFANFFFFLISMYYLHLLLCSKVKTIHKI